MSLNQIRQNNTNKIQLIKSGHFHNGFFNYVEKIILQPSTIGKQRIWQTDLWNWLKKALFEITKKKKEE